MTKAIAPRVGDVIRGTYVIDSVLGRGGMSVVYRARHTGTGRKVALKWMLRPASSTEADVEQFLLEARALGRIEHRSVVGVLDVGMLDDAAFLVVELLRGKSLRTHMDEVGPMTPADAIALLMPAMEGVEAAHRSGVVHLDLKPDNLFLVDGRADGHATTKVLDFGVSKMRDESGATADSPTDHVVGTPHYMSPEQVRARPDLGARTDVWALGVILYEMLAGRRPYLAASAHEVMLAIATEPPEPLERVAPSVPAALVDVVHRALRRDPAERFRDVASFARALEPFASGGLRFRAPRPPSVAASFYASDEAGQSVPPAPPTERRPAKGGDEQPTRALRPRARGAPPEAREASGEGGVEPSPGSTRSSPRRSTIVLVIAAVVAVVAGAYAIVHAMSASPGPGSVRGAAHTTAPR